MESGLVLENITTELPRTTSLSARIRVVVLRQRAKVPASVVFRFLDVVVTAAGVGSHDGNVLPRRWMPCLVGRQDSVGCTLSSCFGFGGEIRYQ